MDFPAQSLQYTPIIDDSEYTLATSLISFAFKKSRCRHNS